MLKKLISILITTSLSLGTFSYITIQPTEAVRYNKRYSIGHRLRRAIKEQKYNGQVGVASHYGHNDGYHGRKTASGKIFNKYSNMCAHNGFRLGTKLKVTNIKNGKSTICQVQDTGAFGKLGRIIDLSYGSFSKIASVSRGTIKVKIEKVK